MQWEDKLLRVHIWENTVVTILINFKIWFSLGKKQTQTSKLQIQYCVKKPCEVLRLNQASSPSWRKTFFFWRHWLKQIRLFFKKKYILKTSTSPFFLKLLLWKKNIDWMLDVCPPVSSSFVVFFLGLYKVTSVYFKLNYVRVFPQIHIKSLNKASRQDICDSAPLFR